jgi:hypothetical protein
MRPALISLALMCAAAPAAAQEPAPAAAVEEEWYVVSDVIAPADCSPETARPVSFTEAISAPLEEGTLGCVTVEGVWDGRNFYAGLDGYYTADRGDVWTPSSVRLGVYGWRDRVGSPERPTPARLTGRIGDCEALSGPNVMMVMGYCHYVYGRYIALGHADPDGRAAERLTGPDERARLGGLMEIDPASPLHAAAEARARDWLALLRTGDAEAYARAYGMQHELDVIDEPESEFHALFRDDHSVFGRLKDQEQTELRVWRRPDPPADLDDPPRDPSDYNVLACFRIGAWTEDRWPVSGADADNNRNRPYACVGLWRDTYRDEVSEGVDAKVNVRGLIEPAEWPD